MIKGYENFISDREAYEIYSRELPVKWYFSFFKDSKLDSFLCGGDGLQDFKSALAYCYEENGEDIEIFQVSQIDLNNEINKNRKKKAVKELLTTVNKHR